MKIGRLQWRIRQTDWALKWCCAQDLEWNSARMLKGFKGKVDELKLYETMICWPGYEWRLVPLRSSCLKRI